METVYEYAVLVSREWIQFMYHVRNTDMDVHHALLETHREEARRKLVDRILPPEHTAGTAGTAGTDVMTVRFRESAAHRVEDRSVDLRYLAYITHD